MKKRESRILSEFWNPSTGKWTPVVISVDADSASDCVAQMSVTVNDEDEELGSLRFNRHDLARFIELLSDLAGKK